MPTKTQDERLRKLVDRINRTSNADFVKRLLDEKRKHIKNRDGSISTHRLGYVIEGDHAVVFPEVQSSGDTLKSFPFPESYERAVANGDTVRMSPEDAELFTKNYKDYYPKGNTFDGRDKSILRRAFDFMANVGQQASENSRDARTAMASSTVRDLIDSGDTEGANRFAKNYLAANLLGIDLGLMGGLSAINPGTVKSAAGDAAALGKSALSALKRTAAKIGKTKAARAVAPGSAFWTNPLTQQFAASTLGGTAIDAGSRALTGKTWGQNLISGLSDVTGYDVSSIPGANFVADMTNPGYLTPYGVAAKAVSYIPGQVQAAKETEAAIRKLRANSYLRDILSNQDTPKFIMQRAGYNFNQPAEQTVSRGLEYDSIGLGTLNSFVDGIAARTGRKYTPSNYFQQDIPISSRYGNHTSGFYPDDWSPEIDFSPLAKRIKDAQASRDRTYNYYKNAGIDVGKPHIVFSGDPLHRSYTTGHGDDRMMLLGVGDVDPSVGSIGMVASHETAHGNALYNTRHRNVWFDKKWRSQESPYYGNDYSSVPDETKRLLAPQKSVNPHDFEAAENYSDLAGLRDDLHTLGIHRIDSRRPYTWADVALARLRSSLPGGNYMRYLDYHDTKSAVKALNSIKALGGTLLHDYGEGGGIHIKPENRGKFTALKKRTGHSASWFKAHGTPAQKKMAVFALNAKKWKHGDGGFLSNVYDGETEDSQRLWRSMNSWGTEAQADQNVVLTPLVYPEGVSSVRVEAKPVEQLQPELSLQALRDIAVSDAYQSDVSDSVRSLSAKNAMLQNEIYDALPQPDIDMDSAAVIVPDRNQKEYFRKSAMMLMEDLDKYKPSGKTKQEIMEMQQAMADSGYYSNQLAGKSKDEIINIQKKLISKGLLSSAKRKDGSYIEADGIVGEKTRKAWNQYNVDGKWGSRSDLAYSAKMSAEMQYNQNWKNDSVPTKGVDGCAKWVTRKFESVRGNTSRQNGVIGSAWQMPKNIENAGGTTLFNLYDRGFDGVKTVSDLKARTRQRLKEENFDLSQLQPGDVVGIYYPLSHHHEDVLKEGTTYNTHVGIVTGYDDDGMPIVEHNVNENHRRDRADKISLGQIVTASRPRNTDSVLTYPFEMGESKYEVDLPEHTAKRSTEEKLANLNAFMDSMAGAADVIGNIYKDADMDTVQRIAVAVLGRETDYMQNTESSRTGKEGRRVKVEKILRGIAGADKDQSRKSSDLTKFKLSTLSQDERNFLGIYSAADLDDPEKAGRASLYTLAKNYDYFARYAKMNPQLGITKEDIADLTALSYNQGMSRLYTVGTEMIDGENLVSPSKLEQIRQYASNPDIIDDFSATKLSRVAEEFPALTKLMKELYNNGYGGRNVSYMQSARQALKNIRQKQSSQKQ